MADSLLYPQQPAGTPTFNDLVAQKSAALLEARNRITNSIQPQQYQTVSVDTGQLSPREQEGQQLLAQQEAERQQLINQNKAEQSDGSGFLTTANLNSSNPFIKAGTHVVNDAALALGGVATIGTNLNALLTDDIPRIYNELGTPDPVRQAYNRRTIANEQRTQLGQEAASIDRQMAKGVINPVEGAARKVALQAKAKGLITSAEDDALLNQRNSLTTSDSYLEQLDNAARNLQESKVTRGQVEGNTVSDAVSAIRGLGNQNAYRSISNANQGDQTITDLDNSSTQKFQEGNWIGGVKDAAASFGKSALNTIGAGIKDPLGVLALAAQTAPQLVNAPITIASSLGAAGEQNANSLAQYQKRTGNAVSTSGEQLGMLAASGAYFATDALTDRLLAKGLKGETNATKALADVTPMSPSKAALGILTKPVTKTLEAALPQAVSEGVQSSIEDNYGSLNPKFDSAAVGQAAGIGGLVSVGLTGKNTVKAGLQEGVLNTMLARPAGLEAIANAKQRQATDAIPTNELTDIAHPSYNPTAAVQRFGNELTPDTTPEQAVDIKTRINDVTSKLDEMVTGLQDRIDAYPEEAAKMERNKAKFAQARIDNANDPEVLKEIDDKEAARQAIFDTQFGTGSTVESLTATLKVKQQQLLQADQFASKYNTIIDSRFPDAVNASKQAQNAPVSDSVEPVVQTPVVQSNAVPTATPAPANIYMNQYISPNDPEFNHPGINTTLLPNGNYKVIGRVDPYGNWVGTPKEDVDTNATPTTVTDQATAQLTQEDIAHENLAKFSPDQYQASLERLATQRDIPLAQAKKFIPADDVLADMETGGKDRNAPFASDDPTIQSALGSLKAGRKPLIPTDNADLRATIVGNPSINTEEVNGETRIIGLKLDTGWVGTPRPRDLEQEVYLRQKKEGDAILHAEASRKAHTAELAAQQTSTEPVINTSPTTETKATVEPVQQSKKEFDDIVSSYPSESTSIAASKLADDTSNDLTDTQRTTLRKLSDAIVVANRTKTLGDVSKDVTEGSKGYRGLNQYISSMMNAVRAGKKAVQGALVSDINSFNDDHAQKAQLVRQAMGMAPKGMAQEVLRTKTGWELGKQIPMSQAMSKKYQAEMHKSGSLAIHSGSETIVKGIEDESSAISVVADTLKAIQESQQAPKQPSKAQEDTLDAELAQITGKKVVVPTEASKPVTEAVSPSGINLDSSEGWVKDPKTKGGYVRHIKDVDKNTQHVVITNEADITNDNPQGISKNELRSTYPDIGTDDYGNSVSWKIIRDANNPDVVKRAEVKDSGITTQVSAGNNKTTDGQFIKEFSEVMGITIHDGVFSLNSTPTATKEQAAVTKAKPRVEAKPVTDKKETVIDKIQAAMSNSKATQHIPKELDKAALATQFIGEGSVGSSTHKIEGAWGTLANTGEYTSADVIMLSSNGARSGAISPVVNDQLQGKYTNIDLAIKAGASFVTDNEAHVLKNSYNIGERALAEYLTAKGYVIRNEGKVGIWTPKLNNQSKSEPVNKEPTAQEALDQFNEQDRAERQARNETRQIKEVGKANEAKVTQQESVPVEETPIVTSEDTTEIQPDVVNAEASEPVDKAKPVKGITAIQATKEERAQLREEMKVDNGKTTTGYQRVNLVRALFTQKASSVLAVAKDLLSTTTDKGIELMTGVLGTTPTTKQQELFDVFTRFAKHQQKSYRDLMNNRANEVNKKGESSTGEFNFKDYLQYLYEGKAEHMEENITTAASVAAFGWLVENGKKFRLDGDAVKSLLGEPNAPNLPYATYSKFSTIGSQRGNVIRSLGSRVYEALGMSVAKDVDAAHKDRFVNALGSMVLQTLIDQNLVQLTPIPKSELNAAIRSLTGKTLTSIETLELAAANGGKKEAEALAKRIKTDKAEALEVNFFIRAAHKTEVVDGKENSLGVSKLIDTLIEANKGTDGLMSKLFGVTSREIAPLTKKPTTFTQAVIDDAGTEVASHLAENVLKASQTAYGVSNLNTVYGNLHDSHRELLLGMLGYKSDAQLADMHVSNRESAEAVNESILRSLDNAFETIGSLRLGESDNYSNFYLPMKVWAVNRVGVMSNMLNEQGDKIHRSLVHVAAHKQEVTIGEPFVDGKITQFGKFLLAVAGGMEGTKSIVGFTSDKTTAGEFIPRFEEYLATPKVQTAIAAMQAIKSGKYSDGDVALVAEIIQEFGMSPMSMAALNALAEYQSGKDSDGVFTTDVSLESDGVTSGSAISLLVYGVTDQTKLAAAGFYIEGDTTPNISTYRAEGKKDLYLQLADQMKAQWQGVVFDEGIPAPIVSAFAFFDRAFGTREGAKGVQTPLIYGSGFKAINAANTSALVQSIYNRLQEIALMPDQVRTEALKTFVSHYNQLAKAAGFPTKAEGLFTSLSKEELLAFEMDNTSIKLLGEYNAATRGKAIKAAVENVVGDMLAVRTNLFAATGAGFTVFNALFKAVYAETVAELKAKGELLVRTDRLGREIPFEDLSPDQLQEVFDKLSKYDSRVNTADGVVSANTKASGMPTYNVTKEVIEADPLNPGIEAQYKSEHKFKRAPYVTNSTFTPGSIRSVVTSSIGKDGEPLSIQVGKSELIATYSRKTVLESKGASVSATLIQGIDAFVSAMTQALHRAAGHHDANTGSIDDAEFMAQTQNKVLMDAVIKTHINSNAIDAILNPLLGIISKEHSHLFNKAEAYAIRREALSSINLGRAYGEKYPSLEVALKSMIKTAYKADLAKLNVIEKLATISQYSLEGGQVKLSQEQRDTIAKEREALRTKYTSVMESVDVINKGINNFKPSSKPVVVAPVVQPTVVEPPVTVVATQTTTEQFLSNYDGGLIPHKELFDHLRSEFKGKKGWYAAGQRSLLELVVRVLPKDLPINVVTEFSATKDTKWYRDDKSHEARAWANSSGITYRLDRDSIHPEVLLHEMVHAITSRALTNPDYKDVQTTLQGLLDTAKAKYDAQSDKSMYDKEQQRIFNHAFSNIKEFTAIAMSNRDMQNFLDQIIIPRTEAKPGLATMFQKFIKSIGSILNKAAGRTTPLDSNTQSVLEATIYNTTQVIQAQFNDAQNQGFDLQSSYPHEQAKADALKKATQYTAAEVFNVLDGSGISNEFNAHLAGVIATVVDNSFSVLEAHDLTGSDTAGYTPYQVWNEKLSQGKVPYASTAMATGFNLSEKELFAVESIEASLNAAMNNGVGTAVHKELKAAFLKARESLKDERVFFAGDWSKASQQQRDQALAKYNLVFKLVGNTNKQEENAYLSRFAALALGSQEFSALLDFPVYTQENRGDKSLPSAISNYFDTAMQWVNGYLSKTVSSQTIKDKLPILAQQLIEIDHKKRDAALPGILDKLHTVQEIGNEVIQDASGKLADKLKDVRGTKVVQTVLKGKVMDNLDVLKDARNKENPNSVLGVAAELLSELANANTAQQGMQKLFRQHEVVQNTRKGMIAAMTKNVLNTFIDGGKNLKQKQLEAVTYGLLRTNAQALLSTHGISGIRDFVSDASKRNAEIKNLESQINDPLLINRTKDLAWYMTSGEGRTGLAKNTTSILRGVGTNTVVDESTIDPAKLDLLDQLNALYAIDFTRKDHRETLKQVITDELSRKGQSGIESTLAYHRGLVEDSKNTLFEGNSVSRIQGWLPEIVNPHREVAIATTEADAKELERLGFHLHSQPKTDPNDPVSGTRKLYMTEESTKTRFTTGALSLTTTARKGTSVFTGSDVKGKAAYQAIDKMGKQTASYLSQHTDPNYDPRKGNTSMIPTYANDGSIIDYNYEMSHESRDSLLQRNNNFAQILGSYAGTNYDKMESPKHNDVVLKAIHDQFLEGYAASPEAYVEISPHANDPRLREIYAMLPHDAKQTMEKLWGKGEPMMIRNDLLLSTFGAHKLTIGSAFDKNPEQRNIIENTVVSTLEAMFGDQAKLKGLRAERAWQEVAGVMKSFVVIRNVKTLIGNQMSNTGVLMAMGVNPIDIYQDSAIALKGALQYRKDTAIIINANQQLRAGLGIPSEHHQDILRAQDSLARNPVRDFIAAGMLTSIVEDISLEEDPYSYKSKYAQRLDEMTGGVPDGVKTALSYAFVSPKTPLYQLLADATQFSDFTAKYVLYKNSTTKAKKKLSHDEAINLADKMFINYGVPTSPELQYMNDMGFLMFTKYTLRIQRAMAHLLKEHPAGTLGEVLLANQMGSVSVLDPLFLNNIQNPLRTGILGMPSVIDEPFPVAMLKGLLF